MKPLQAAITSNASGVTHILGASGTIPLKYHFASSLSRKRRSAKVISDSDREVMFGNNTREPQHWYRCPAYRLAAWRSHRHRKAFSARFHLPYMRFLFEMFADIIYFGCQATHASTRRNQRRRHPKMQTVANTRVLILPLRLSNLLLVISPRVKHLELKHLTHFSLMGSQLHRKYVKAAGMFIPSVAAHWSSHACSDRATTMALKIASSVSRCLTRIPIFSIVTLRRVWNKRSWREAGGNTSENTLRSAISLSVITTSVHCQASSWALDACRFKQFNFLPPLCHGNKHEFL